MTRVLSINYNRGRSSVISSESGRIREGRVLAGSAFPRSTVREIKDVHDDWEYAVCMVPSLYTDFRTSVRSLSNATPVLVDYREALAMSSIAMRDWDSCAVMVVDSFCCSLGYYNGKQFHWLREFKYPNSIALFYSAAARFLGFDPLTEEHHLVDCSQYGNPVFAPWIQDNVVNTSDGEYTLLRDLTRGVGIGTLNLDIAASVQAVFDACLLHLASWLSKAVDSKRLAYAGRASANYLTNTKIATFSGFNELLIQPLTSYAGAVVGAASLVSRSIFDSVNIGQSASFEMSADVFAQQLLRGKIMPHINGRAEFADTSFINRNRIAIPFDSLIPVFKQQSNFTYNWQSPVVLCQEQDYNKYYEGPCYPTHGQFISKRKPGTPKFTNEYSRVVTTSITSNAYMNRVLEVTRDSGYPILISSPL